MKRFTNIFISDLKRAFLSILFVFSVVGYVAATLLLLFDEGTDFQPGITTIVYIYTIIRYLDFHIIYLLFAAIPSALLFYLDCEHKFFYPILVRCPKIYYTTSKILTCFIMSASSVFLSNLVLFVIFTFQYPLTSSSDILPTGFGSNGVIFYLLAKLICEAACAAFLSMAAMFLSTISTNPFVALASPIALYYFISTSSYFFNLPPNLHIAYLSQGTVQVSENPILSLLYILIAFIIATLICGYLFSTSCLRRIQNE